MRRGPGIRLAPTVGQNRRQAALAQRRPAGALVGEEAKLGHEADVGKGDGVADQVAPVGMQRLLDAGQVDGESLGCAGVEVGRQVVAPQGEEIGLRVTPEDQTGIEEAVDAGRLVGIAAVELAGCPRPASPPLA